MAAVCARSADDAEAEVIDRELEIAWAAGLFEGEGTILLWKDVKTGRTYPRLDLSSTDEDVVLGFSRVLGNGKAYGPYQRRQNPTHKPFWRCVISGEYARDALALMAPYLRSRRAARMDEVLAQASVPVRRGKQKQTKGATQQ